MSTPMEILGNHQQPPPGMMFPPSHVTRAQVARIIGRSVTLAHRLARKGAPLEAEVWYGTPMVPIWRVMAYLKARDEVAG